MSSEATALGALPAGITIRPASDRDADAAAAVWLASRRRAAPAVPPPVHTDEEIRRWFASDLVPRGGVWLATTSGGTTAGVMVVEHGWLDQLYVHPDFWGRGVGSALVELAKRRSSEGLELWTFQANAAARRLYERLGFELVALTDGEHNDEHAPDARYRWTPSAGDARRCSRGGHTSRPVALGGPCLQDPIDGDGGMSGGARPGERDECESLDDGPSG